MAVPDLQRYPWKLCLIKYELHINVFVSYFHLRFLCEIPCKLDAMVKSEKRRYLPHFFSDKGFKGTVVNLTMPSLPWRVTWDYAYSPFKYKIYNNTVYALGGNVWGYKEGEGMEKTAGTKG